MSTYERLVNSQKFFSPYLTQEDIISIGRTVGKGDFILGGVPPRKSPHTNANNDQAGSQGDPNLLSPAKGLGRVGHRSQQILGHLVWGTEGGGEFLIAGGGGFLQEGERGLSESVAEPAPQAEPFHRGLELLFVPAKVWIAHGSPSFPVRISWIPWKNWW